MAACLSLQGNCTSNQNGAYFMHYLKTINTFLTNNMNNICFRIFIEYPKANCPRNLKKKEKKRKEKKKERKKRKERNRKKISRPSISLITDKTISTDILINNSRTAWPTKIFYIIYEFLEDAYIICQKVLTILKQHTKQAQTNQQLPFRWPSLPPILTPTSVGIEDQWMLVAGHQMSKRSKSWDLC